MRKGMTIVELVVVIVVLSIVMLFVTNFMIFQHKSIAEQKAKIETNKRIAKTYDYIAASLREVGYCQNTSVGGFGIVDGNIGATIIKPDATHLTYTTDQDESGTLNAGDAIIIYFSGDTLYKHQNGNSSILVTDIDSLQFLYRYENGDSSLAPAAGTYGLIRAIDIHLKASCKYGNKTYEKEYTGVTYLRNVN